jgi:AbrB family looped-hinge helix DNA binding protein
MITTIDAAGRIVIPKALRDSAGLVPGAELRVELDGSGIHIEAAPGQDLATSGHFLTIPSSGDSIDDEVVQQLRRTGQR